MEDDIWELKIYNTDYFAIYRKPSICTLVLISFVIQLYLENSV